MRVGSAHVFRSWGAIAYGNPAARCDSRALGTDRSDKASDKATSGLLRRVSLSTFRTLEAGVDTDPSGQSLRRCPPPYRGGSKSLPGLIPRGTPTQLRLHITLLPRHRPNGKHPTAAQRSGITERPTERSRHTVCEDTADGEQYAIVHRSRTFTYVELI